MTILLREAVGDRLRHARTTQQRTLRDISRAARVSLGYLSEVERGQKEASSELLASICQALELPLDELLHHVATDVGAAAQVGAVDEMAVEYSDGAAPLTGSARQPGAGAASGSVPGEEKSIQGGTIVPPMVGSDRSEVTMPSSVAHRFRARLGSEDVVIAA